MASFKNFIESEVPISQMRTIRKNLGNKYRPETFGIEVEFKAGGEPIVEEEFDDNAAKDAFRRETEKGESLESWLEENKEPEKPKQEDYEYSNTDPLVNLWNLNMEREPVNAPLPTPLKKYSNRQTEQLFNDLPERVVDYLKYEIDSLITRTDKLWRGLGYWYHGHPSWSMLANTKNLHDFIRQFKSINDIADEKFENQIRIRFGDDNIQFNRNQVNFLEELQSSIEEATNEFVRFHVERAKQITPEIYAPKIEELWKEDMDEWETEYSEWEEQKEEAEENDYDEDKAFQEWLNKRPPQRFRHYETNRDRFIIRNEFEDDGNVAWEIKDVKIFIQNNGGDDDWRVFEDETGVVEVASPILTTKDMGFLKILLNYLATKEFNSSTGLHVHIGMPATTDGFDLLAMVATIDEESISLISHRTFDSTDNYAKKKNNLFSHLWYVLPTDGILTNKELESLLNNNVDRCYGVNTIKAFKKHGTVEMRYLSSKILDRPQAIENLFKFINYFLMLPKLAQGRNQIRYDVIGVGSIIFSRRPGGRTEIKRFSINKKPTVPMTPEPVANLRQPQEPEKPEDKKIRLQQKFSKLGNVK